MGDGFFVTLTYVFISTFILCVRHMPRIVEDRSSETTLGLARTSTTLIATAQLVPLEDGGLPAVQRNPTVPHDGISRARSSAKKARCTY